MSTFRNKNELVEQLIGTEDVVLDVGFQGQGIQKNDPQWPHFLIKQKAKEVYGLDLKLHVEFQNNTHYLESSAEDFSFPVFFDVIFAGDVIEHLSNPGLFLFRCKKHLKQGGRLIITTPSAFNLFNLTEKLTKSEPTVNSDHTCYFNSKTITVLLRKNGFQVQEVSWLYTLGCAHKESWKKKFLNMIYRSLFYFTPKFLETLVVVAVAE
jgi:2-polyprenyl-3-methyl-5-hydroxy-6-metoxy-1,4-benzoquinol methylase